MRVKKCQGIRIVRNNKKIALAHLLCDETGEIMDPVPENISGFFIIEALRINGIKKVSLYKVIEDDWEEIEIEEQENLLESHEFKVASKKALQQANWPLACILFVRNYSDGIETV